MLNFKDKTVFLGIDVHKSTYSVTAICEGEVMKKATFIASPEILVTFCKNSFPEARIKSAYEAGFSGFVLHRFLIQNKIENIVVHPASIETESRNFKKNDKRDSKKIATQLSVGRLQGIYIPTQKAEYRRYVTRLRELFVKQRTRTAVQIKSLLHLNGLISINKNVKISKKVINEFMALELEENLKFCLQELFTTWLYFAQKVDVIEQKTDLLTPEEQELYKCYRKITGIGHKIAKILVHELGDTMQFSNEEKLFSFCGLTPTEHSSGEHKRLGHITRQGKSILRKVLVQSAWVAVRKDPHFKELFESLKARRGACRAIIAIARKLIGRARCAIKKKDKFKR